MHTFHLDMVTPLPTSSFGKNTFRATRLKYKDLQAGDRVIMTYLSTPGGTPMAHEELIVKSVFRSCFKWALAIFWRNNHANPKSNTELQELIESIYPDTEESSQFTVITFV